MTLIPKIVAHFETSLASKITAAAASAILVSIADKAGVNLSGYVGVTIDEGTATEEECLGTLSGTTLTFALRGLDPQNPTLEVAALKFQHRRGASVKITDAPILAIVRGLLNGELSLPSKLIYATDLTFTDDKELIPKKYADGLAIAGAPDASTTTKGLNKMSVAPASPTSPIAVGDNDPRLPTQGENDALVGKSGTTPSTANKFEDEGDTSAVSANNKLVRANGSGKIDDGFLQERDINVQSYTAGETLALGDPVYIKPSDGRVWKGSASTLTDTMQVLGFALESKTAGQAVLVQVAGLLSGLTLPTLSATIAETTDISETSTANTRTFDGTGYTHRQTFITGDTVGNMTAVELYLSKTGTPGDVLSANIYEVGTDGLQTGGTLGTVTFANADVPGAQFVKKTFGSPISLKPRTKYMLAVSYGTYVATNYFSWSYQDTNFLKGELYPNNAPTTPVVSGEVFAFKTYYTSQVNAYIGDNVYLSDAGGIALNEGTYRLKLGKIISATSILIDLAQAAELPIKEVGIDLGGAISSEGVSFAIPRNAYKMLVRVSINSSYNSGGGEAMLFVKNKSAALASFGDSNGGTYLGIYAVITGNRIRFDAGNGNAGANSSLQRYLKILFFR